MKGITHTIALMLATSLVLGLSGCTDSKSDPQPSPSVSVPTTSAAKPAPTTTPAAPVQAQPGPAHVANYSYKSDSNIPQASFEVNESWSKLHFNVQMFKSAQCGLVQAEPPAGTGTGPQPQVTFTSPSGQKIGPMSLGTYSSCDVNTNNKVGTSPAPVMTDAEKGTWKIDINGRGVNVYLQISVMGTA